MGETKTEKKTNWMTKKDLLEHDIVIVSAFIACFELQLER